MSDKTIKERVSELEQRQNKLEDLILYEFQKSNTKMDLMSDRVEKMYPIVKDIMYVKGYGGFTWKILKWIGGISFSLLASWHLFKEHIKHFIHYIFN